MGDGYVITARHVVRQAWPLVVRMSDGTVQALTLVGADETSDLALLAIDAAGALQLPAMRQPELGDVLFAGGTAFGLGVQVVSGEVTRPIAWLGEPAPRPFIQTDLPIVSGASGGPVFGAEGTFVGLASFVYSGSGNFEGVSFLTPAETIQRVGSALADRGYAELPDPGLALTDGVCEQACARVLTVRPDGPAGSASPKALAVGDVIVRIAGAPIRASSAVLQDLATHLAMGNVEVDALRDGRSFTATLAPGTRRPMKYLARVGALAAEGCSGHVAWEVMRLDLPWVGEDGLRVGDCISDFDLSQLTAGAGPLRTEISVRRGDGLVRISLSEPH